MANVIMMPQPKINYGRCSCGSFHAIEDMAWNAKGHDYTGPYQLKVDRIPTEEEIIAFLEEREERSKQCVSSTMSQSTAEV